MQRDCHWGLKNDGNSKSTAQIVVNAKYHATDTHRDAFRLRWMSLNFVPMEQLGGMVQLMVLSRGGYLNQWWPVSQTRIYTTNNKALPMMIQFIDACIYASPARNLYHNHRCHISEERIHMHHQRQTISRFNDYPIHRRVYSPPGLSELKP